MSRPGPVTVISASGSNFTSVANMSSAPILGVIVFGDIERPKSKARWIGFLEKATKRIEERAAWREFHITDGEEKNYLGL